MPNKRIKQIQKSVLRESIEDRFKRLSDAVYERLTDDLHPCPSREIVAMQLVKDGKIPSHMSPAEKNFLWACLNCVQGGEEFTEDSFFEAALAAFKG